MPVPIGAEINGREEHNRYLLGLHSQCPSWALRDPVAEMVGDLVISVEPGEPVLVDLKHCHWVVVSRSILAPMTLHYNQGTQSLEIVAVRKRVP